jgi:hypothetical protein
MNDVLCQVEKTKAAFEAHVVYPLLVSEQQKLCGSCQAEDSSAADAAADGSQGRMASLELLLHSSPISTTDNHQVRSSVKQPGPVPA